ncbi:MAG TPA: STAS domain-containing protein [Vicinamibacterales bacterium]|nr:STAS domain-containing protein [Vicinamibacterales bacterium]
MKLSERRRGGLTIIDISGDLIVTENAGALKEMVLSLLQRGDRAILLNVAALGRMDSACLGDIVASYTTTAAHGGTLKLVHVGEHLRHLLEVTNLDAIFETYETEADAIASAGAST